MKAFTVILIVAMCGCASLDVLHDWYGEIKPHIPEKEEPVQEPEPPTPTNVVELSDCHWIASEMAAYFPPRFKLDNVREMYRQTSDGQHTQPATGYRTLPSAQGQRIRGQFLHYETYPHRHDIVIITTERFGRWRVRDWRKDESQLEEVKK